MTGTSLPTRETWKLQKKSQKGGPGTFWFDKWRPEGVFHV